MVPAVVLALWAAAAGVVGLDAELVVRTDGVVEVTETVVVRPDKFPAERAILVRKPLDDSEGIRAGNPRPGPDRVWKVSNVAVSRPDGTQVKPRVVEVDPGRVDVFDSTDG